MTGPLVTPIDERGSFTWIAHPDEWMARASSAIVTPDGVIVVDPVDMPDLDGRLEELGPIAGIVQLLDRHGRDCRAVARRLGTRLLVPTPLTGRGEPVSITGVEEIPIPAVPGWREAALWLPGPRLLVCAEAVGTVDYYRARDGDALGVHPLLRLRPPRSAFAGVDPVTIACGHGPPLLDGAGEALRRALARSRRDLPALLGRTLVRLGRGRRS